VRRGARQHQVTQGGGIFLGRQSGWTHPSWIDNSQTLLLRFTKKAKSSLRRKRSVRLAVAVTFTPKGGGAAQTASARLTLRR
jgi:hypothetical protein